MDLKAGIREGKEGILLIFCMNLGTSSSLYRGRLALMNDVALRRFSVLRSSSESSVQIVVAHSDSKIRSSLLHSPLAIRQYSTRFVSPDCGGLRQIH